jgi:hypothetical protein
MVIMGRICISLLLLLFIASPALVAQDDLGPAWKNQIAFPEDPFASWTSPAFIKFTIITKDGYDPNVVYFQDSTRYEYHYAFALEQLEPFIGMTIEQFDAVTLHKTDQQAVLGAVILPPGGASAFQEYGIQLVRNDPYMREEIVELFHRVKARIAADPNVTAYYFPSYEQYPIAEQNREWFKTQGVPIGSTAQWVEGNIGYSSGWALGRLVFVPGSSIQAAYQSGDLRSGDLLLTDGVPAEVPSVAGIISLMPSTPNSHVAILARSQGVPFVHLAVTSDADAAKALIGHQVYLTVDADSSGLSCEVTLLDMDGLGGDDRAGLLKLKESPQLVIHPITHDGRFWADTNDLSPSDIGYFGGKASNFGILRRAIPDSSPRAMAFSFDLWAAFLRQPLTPTTPVVLEPGHYALLWADGEPEQGPMHLGFKLSKSGEDIGLFAADGMTLIDSLTFGPQQRDVSYGRAADGGTVWQFFNTPTPGQSNGGIAASGLVINEFMAENTTTLVDADEAGEHPDWIELYNGTGNSMTLNGLFVTDDLNQPAQWQIPPVVAGATLGDEITRRLSKYTVYPPTDMKALSTDLAAIRSLFTNPAVTSFGELNPAVLNALTTFGFSDDQTLRFRSSTNVEDSEQFTGAGLYESYSGTMADGSVLDAIRRVFASFYFDNAFLERLKHSLDESQVGMAVLVHSSFPNEIELANGVATMSRTDRVSWSVDLVSQKGSVSVTNPPVDVIAERVRIEGGAWGVMPWVAQASSLVSLREGTVLEWDQEYLRLYDLLVAAAEAYCSTVQKDSLTLDLEYKKISPDNKLIIKQIRQVPQAGDAMYAVPFLWDQPKVYCTLQGRGSDVFTSHRLKARWTITPKGLWLNADNLNRCIYNDVQIEYAAEGAVHQFRSSLVPPSEHKYDVVQTWYDSYSLSDSWELTGLSNSRTCRLLTAPLFQATVSAPVVTLDNFRLGVQVDYARSVSTTGVEMSTIEETSLYQPWEPAADETPEVCSLSDPNTGVTLETQFYMQWGWGADSPTSIQFKQTRIEGLTTEPIVLTGFFSQSVGGGSHLCPKNFLFEPQLELGISQQTLDELKARNVRLIFYTTGARECRPTEWQDTPPFIRLYGFDDPFDGHAGIQKVPVYRFWSPLSGDHFYTSSETERQKLNDMGPQKWSPEGIAWFAVSNDDDPNAVPVYRFWSAAQSSHFYTISESEKTKLLTTLSDTWAYEGICFYVYAEARRPADTTPVYRLWSDILGKHFYTVSETERNKLTSMSPLVWASEGIAWYAYPP